MPTSRETTLQALLAVLQTVPAATVLREEVLPERLPAGGLVILRDGDPGAPEVTLSPLAYHYEHRAEIEVIVQGKTPATRATTFDTLVQAIGTALVANFGMRYVSVGNSRITDFGVFQQNRRRVEVRRNCAETDQPSEMLTFVLRTKQGRPSRTPLFSAQEFEREINRPDCVADFPEPDQSKSWPALNAVDNL